MVHGRYRRDGGIARRRHMPWITTHGAGANVVDGPIESNGFFQPWTP